MKSILKLLTLVYAIGLILMFACSSSTSSSSTLSEGNWLFKLHVDESNPDRVLPFNVVVIDKNQLLIQNSTEEIKVTEIKYYADSVSFIMPVFGSEFKAKIINNTLVGNWHKYNISEDFKIPFTADFGTSERFISTDSQTADFSGRWQSFFINDSDTSTAIGIFGQSGKKVTGTFLTETGDYRYLEGIANGNELKLSTFDGAHAFLFEATMNDKGELNGTFRSGSTWETRWLGSKNPDAKLGDMKNLTYLKPGYNKLSFDFLNENGEYISLEDEMFQNKVVIVQIFGTWCPNCMDETRYLVEVYNKYKDEGLEVIGLDFEPKPNLEYFKSRISRFRQDLNVPYTLLLAGHSNKQKAAESLPMLNHILSYPTAIIIDKKGEIREIHTGFSGPGTGKTYDEYTKETESLIQSLLSE